MFIIVDFPTFGRPTIAAKPEKNFVSFFTFLFPHPVLFAQRRRPEAIWEQLCQRHAVNMPVPRHKDLQIGRELIQRLTACTAGIRRRTARSDGNLREFTISLADRLHQRSALGAERVAVGGIFDVAAGENMSVFGFQSRTDRIAGIRHIGEFHRGKRLTDKPFGVNLMLMNPCADEMAQIIIEEGVQVVTTGAGSPGKYIPAWKEAGIKVLPVVAASILAKRLVNQGADAIIAEGMESGGHVGEMTTMALVPQVVDAVHVPVIAAGGIADGRGLAAALALGACGVQVGTCLLASTECPIHENYKAALLKARDSDTIVTGRIGGTPVRVLKTRMSREYVRQEKAGADKMALERFTLGSLRKAVFDGDTENGSLMAGQAAGLLHEVRPVEEIFAAMVSEAKTCITGLYKETI